MAAAQSTRTPPRKAAEPTFTAIFAFEAATNERVVARLYGFTGDGQSVRVAAEIYVPRAEKADEPLWHFSDFSSRELANRFADETLLALEYLGCTVTEPHRRDIQTVLGAISSASAA